MRKILKIQNQLRDKPFISIGTKGITSDTVYAWHADAACETEYKMIGKKLWKLGVPPKCFYWNNITSVVFFKLSNRNHTMEEKQTAEFIGFDYIEIINRVSFRFFDDERFILILDDEDKTVNIEYE